MPLWGGGAFLGGVPHRRAVTGPAPALAADVIAQDRPQEGGAGLAAAVRVEPVDQLRGQTHGKRTHDSVARGVEPYPV